MKLDEVSDWFQNMNLVERTGHLESGKNIDSNSTQFESFIIDNDSVLMYTQLIKISYNLQRYQPKSRATEGKR